MKFCVISTVDGSSQVYGEFATEAQAEAWVQERRRAFNEGDDEGIDAEAQTSIVPYYPAVNVPAVESRRRSSPHAGTCRECKQLVVLTDDGKTKRHINTLGLTCVGSGCSASRVVQ